MGRNNFVGLSGTVDSGLWGSRDVRGDIIYDFELSCRSASGAVDRIACRLSGRAVPEGVLAVLLSNGPGMCLRLTGQCVSQGSGIGKEGSSLSVSVDTVEIGGSAQSGEENGVYLRGSVCETSGVELLLGGVKVCRALISVDRMCHGHDLIPCLFWGRDAESIFRHPAGTRVLLDGSIHCRDREWSLGTELEVGTVCDVSVEHFYLLAGRSP